MKDINYLYDLLKISDISLLGYRFKQERLKDEIISKLPHLVVPEIDSSFSFKSFLRGLKLESILETGEPVKNPEYIVLDLINIKTSETNAYIRPIQIGKIIENIRKDMYSNCSSSYPYILPYKLLIITSLSSSWNNKEIVTNFSGGSQPIYMSDLAIVMQDDSMRIIKNRFDHNDIDVSYDKLKDYNYICNYENNN
jgi:hypothetical protein